VKKTEEMQGFFKKAMLAYFVICGIGAFVAVSPPFHLIDFASGSVSHYIYIIKFYNVFVNGRW